MAAERHEPSWWLAAADPEALLVELERHADAAAANGSGPRHISAGSGPARLGIVAPDERKVRLARRLVAKGEPWRGRSDIWFTPAGLCHGNASGKVAFLFPGVEPTFDAAATDLPRLADRFGLEAPPLEDDSVAHRAASIYRVGILLDRVLRAMGVEPDVIAGHSIGEWSGTVAAGIVPRHSANKLLDVVDLDSVEFPDFDFAALSAGVEAVRPVIDSIEDIYVSHDNSPRQSVICGRPHHVKVALDRLRAAGILGYTLPFQSGFHIPVIAPIVDIVRPDAQSLPFGPAEVPMWSATTVAPYPDDRQEIIELHLRHLVETVRFRPMVERLYDDVGVRVFIQVGLGSLAGFVDQTLDGRDHLAVSALTAKRSALAQAHRVLTALWVEGTEVAVDALDDGNVPPPARPLPSAEALPVARANPRQPPSGTDHQRLQNDPPTTRPATPTPAAVAGARRAVAVEQLLATVNMLSAAAHASRGVVDALAARYALPAPGLVAAAPAPTAPAAPSAPPAPPAPAAPAVTWPTEPLTLVRRMSLETMPETLDHRLFNQPEGWPDPADGFPIVAMTTQIQMLQDIATDLAPGRDVVEVSGVRNTRWLELSEPQDVEITATPRGDDLLAMSLGRYCRANLRLGRFPTAPRPSSPPLTRPRPTRHTAEEMFQLRIMFHGPRYHGVTQLGPIGDNGMAGEFHQLETPGSLLDNLGKLIAYWVIDQRGLGEAALPIAVESIRFFGPEPPPGTDVHCDIRIVDLQRDKVTADGELVLPDGTVCCRVERWSSIVFHRDEVVEQVTYNPSRRYMTEPQPGGWNVVQERWPTGPGRELTARRYTTRAERAAFDQLNLLQERRWLLELVAAKDTVRRWLGETYGIPCFPAEVTLEATGERRFRAVCPLVPEQHDLHVTVSTIDWLTVAILSDGEPGDIDARVIPDGADPGEVGAEAAEAVAARNPGRRIDSVAPVTDLVPSRLDVVVAPRFAVAWTAACPAHGTPSSEPTTPLDEV